MHTALSFPLVGEDVLITGAGPIGLMAAAVARHAGARNVVITDVSEYRLELARKIGVDLALNVARARPSPTAQRELGMGEGFDVGLEMSGHPEALRDMIANMTHGGRIAMLGLPAEEFADRLGQGRHLHDHDQGHLRPRDVRDLVRDVGAAARAASTSRPVITAPLPATATSRRRSTTARERPRAARSSSTGPRASAEG